MNYNWSWNDGKKQTSKIWRIRKTFFLIIDFLSYSERLSLSFNNRSLFNCAHSVAFQNQLIVISFILRCLSVRSSFGLPDRPQGNNNEMLLCFERRTEIVWLPVVCVEKIDKFHPDTLCEQRGNLTETFHSNQLRWLFNCQKFWRRLNSSLSDEVSSRYGDFETFLRWALRKINSLRDQSTDHKWSSSCGLVLQRRMSSQSECWSSEKSSC